MTWMGRNLEKTATPEQPEVCLEKFQQPWQPVSSMGDWSQLFSSILVSVMQRMSGWRELMQAQRAFLLMMERMPLTFQFPSTMLAEVVPSPLFQRWVLVLCSVIVSSSSSLKILFLLLGVVLASCSLAFSGFSSFSRAVGFLLYLLVYFLGSICVHRSHSPKVYKTYVFLYEFQFLSTFEAVPSVVVV